MSKRNKVYIVIGHSYTPNPRPTSADDTWNVNETCEFVSHLSNRHIKTASVILDYMKKEVTKTRVADVAYAGFMAHIEKTYPERIARLKELLGETSEAAVSETTEESVSEVTEQ